MARKQTVRISGDLRAYPRYSIDEAAAYLRIPKSTLESWVRGYRRIGKSGSGRRYQGLIELADPDRRLFSFFNLAEAYVLRFARRREVPLSRIRLAMEYIREHCAEEHPLLRPDFATRGKSIFLRELGLPVNASRYGQLGMREILEQHLQGIKRAPDGLPEEISPVFNKQIAINPSYSSGQPIVAGTGIMVSILANRKRAGESLDEIARDYGLEPRTIEKAIKTYAAA